MDRRPLLQAERVSKFYQMGELQVKALVEADLTVYDGEFLVILGPSGSGKSTLLHLLGAMDTPTSGRILFRGEDLASLDDHGRTLFRREQVGFVFQFFSLIQNLTAEENVALALELTGRSKQGRTAGAAPGGGAGPKRARELLAEVGLADRAAHFPSEMSGGEQQRVAIARALAGDPALLLCDEPTGSLDFETGRRVLEILESLNKERQKTVVVITHNAAIAEMAHRVVHMHSGRISRIAENASPKPAGQVHW